MALEITQILNLILSNINPLKIWKSVNPLPLKSQILSLSLSHTHTQNITYEVRVHCHTEAHSLDPPVKLPCPRLIP